MSFTFKKGLLLVFLILSAAVLLLLAGYFHRPSLGLAALVAIACAINVIARMLLGGPTERTLRYLKRKPMVRLQLVKAVAAESAAQIPRDFSPLELASLFALLLARESMDIVLLRTMRLAGSAIDNRFDDEFFEQLTQTAAEFRATGMTREFRTIIQFGGAAAKQFGNTKWEEAFRQQRNQMLQHQVDNTPVIQWRP